MKGFHEWVDRMENGTGPNSSQTETEAPEEPQDGVDSTVERTVAKIPIYEDQSYFQSYAHFDIHYNMLSVS